MEKPQGIKRFHVICKCKMLLWLLYFGLYGVIKRLGYKTAKVTSNLFRLEWRNRSLTTFKSTHKRPIITKIYNQKLKVSHLLPHREKGFRTWNEGDINTIGVCHFVTGGLFRIILEFWNYKNQFNRKNKKFTERDVKKLHKCEKMAKDAEIIACHNDQQRLTEIELRLNF